MYKALYTDFRPNTFEEMVGQDHIVKILQNQLEAGSTSHAYLFCGTRGTGKTTTARILAKALNCENDQAHPCCECDTCRAIREGTFIDVVEIDAASNNGVDSVRELRDSINYPPVSGRYKVYIIDEVHMMSTGAFNALLKTLEEPPEYVVFILATTEPQKIPATILSRCVRLDFRRVSEQKLIENMRKICDARGVEAEESALALIAINADGSVRDSLSILEQCMFPGQMLRRDDVAQILGTAGEEALIALTESVRVGDAAEALLQLDRMIASGIDVRLLMKQWLEHYRNLLLVKFVQDPGALLSMSMENAARVGVQAKSVSTAFLDRAIRELTETISGTRWSPRPRVMLEMSAVKLCASQETAEAFQLRYDGAMAGFVPAGTQTAAPVSTAPEAAKPAERPIPEKPDRTDDLWSATDIYDDVEPPEDWDPLELTEAAPVEPLQEAAMAQPQAGPVPETEPMSEPSAKKAAAAEAGLADLDRIWQQIMDEAADQRGIFTRYIGRSHMTKTDSKCFYISCDDKEMEEFLALRGRKIVEDLMAQRMGRRLDLAFDIRKAQPKAKSEKSSGVGKKEELEKFFGRPVEMK